MNRIDRKFIQLKNQGKKAFIAFITAGFPDLSTTAGLVMELEKKGVDLIELGVPFSDPLADGPTIQEASGYSLKKGTNLVKILELVKRLRKVTDVPICLMTYYNPVFCFGQKAFVDRAQAAGVDGVIIPDLPFEEAREFSRYANQKQLANICFITPTSSLARIKAILKVARGFIYYVSLTGVTGGRKNLSSDLKIKLAAIKKLTTKPVCVGFGISNAGQVRQVGRISDGVIVGSAIVAQIKKNMGRANLVQRVGEFVGKLNV
ncbi:MAG TPA: tryptophan synthase subunit alpha [Candidatus Omnitrophota bacterium]|nr:tryptophan synthase subunit alpha [Candidatus Omnitrophota bacterium]HPT38617.1 tryptophan synthase subunit alpha [Candidatus Omnitrophota bacterium]